MSGSNWNERKAEFSLDRRYRYVLRRRVGSSSTTCLFICLNPSTADEYTDDPTVRRCIGFTKRWGFGILVVCNLFGFRATSPEDMKAQQDSVGPENDTAILREALSANRVVCAWGNHGVYLDRWLYVLEQLHGKVLALHHFGFTQAGQPKHPLYLKGGTEPQIWEYMRP